MQVKKEKYGRKMAVMLIAVSVALFGMLAAYRTYYKTAYPQRYSELVQKYSQQYGVDENLVYGVIKVESDFRKDAVSVDDACGLMQILPSTFEWLQTLEPSDEEYGREDLFDPEINIRYGVFYLSWLQENFNDTKTVIAAYHAGANAVSKWLGNEMYSSDGLILDKIPYADTAYYVRVVSESYSAYRSLYK